MNASTDAIARLRAMMANSREKPPDTPKEEAPATANHEGLQVELTSEIQVTPESTGVKPALLCISSFPNVNADSKIAERRLTWEDLKAQLANPKKEHARKEDCKLIKLARFNGSRCDANVAEVYGVEGDHDAETMTLAEAAALLKAAGIKACVYTSASHGVVNPPKSHGGPRWRVIVPLAKPVPPTERARYVRLVNGVLRGELSTESFVLSQIFYVGRVAGSTYGFHSIDGAYIDELEALGVLPEPIGKPGGASTPVPDAVPLPLVDMPELLSAELTPRWEKLNLPERVRKFLSGEPAADESRELKYVANALYEHTAGDGAIHDDVVMSILVGNPAAMGVALKKRQGDHDRAVEYLWKYHCAQARGKALEAVANTDDFRDEPGAEPIGSPLHAYYAFLPQHMFIHRATRQLFPAPSVDGHLRDFKINNMKPTAWLDKCRAVHQMTWDPNRGEVIDGEIVADGGWIKSRNQLVYNTYRAPLRRAGDEDKAGPWLEHVQRIFPDSYQHIVRWFAHRVQRPGEKVNHAIVLGGNQGIGKDTAIEPLKDAVGRWNWNEVTPQQMLGRFNGFAQSVVLRVSEARDLGEVDRFKFYDHSKQYIAAPPDVIRVDEKHRREFPVVNVMGVIITTNHKTDGIYLPADDRRHYVAWSPCSKEEFAEGYWNELWAWLGDEGCGHVAAYLRSIDLASFDPKAPPPRTEAFHAIVTASQDPEDDELGNVLEQMGRPAAVTMYQVLSFAVGGVSIEMHGGSGSRKFLHMMERADYSPLRNPDNQRGRWSVGKKWTLIFARTDLSLRDRYAAARELLQQLPTAPTGTL